MQIKTTNCGLPTEPCLLYTTHSQTINVNNNNHVVKRVECPSMCYKTNGNKWKINKLK